MTENERDRLAKAIDEKKWWVDRLAVDAYDRGFKDGLADAATVVREWPVESPWISVEDFLPNEGTTVIIARDARHGSLWIAKHMHGDFLDPVFGGRLDDVTHWMRSDRPVVEPVAAHDDPESIDLPDSTARIQQARRWLARASQADQIEAMVRAGSMTRDQGDRALAGIAGEDRGEAGDGLPAMTSEELTS